MARTWLLVCFFLSLICGLPFGSPLAHAQMAVPTLSGRVIDQTSSLSPDQLARLSQSLASFEQRKGSQIAVLIVASTLPETIEQYAVRVAEQWRLGRKKVDDGALLVVAKTDRTLRIEVGYGLEGVLTDAVSKRIIDETIVPRFRQQDFAGGIASGAEKIMSVVDGEPLPAPRQDAGNGQDISGTQATALAGMVLVSLITRGVLGAFFGALVTAGLTVGVAWWLTGGFIGAALAAGGVAFVVTLVGVLNLLSLATSGGGGFGGGRSGGSGGGFSGGGGSFGGGGASGRW
jgi:uncharacterized protein